MITIKHIIKRSHYNINVIIHVQLEAFIIISISFLLHGSPVFLNILTLTFINIHCFLALLLETL